MTSNLPNDETQRRPLTRIERRVLGVLIEKAKTTPDNYPLTVSSLVSGCNQKSNRDPQMNLDEDQVSDALDSLRQSGAVREVQGAGRVNKYRHAGYEWMDVNSAQAAIMTELLLRGSQTAGELRARAGRMEAFDSLDVVQETLEQLESKGLVRPLSPPGRGQQFAHTLYEPHELDKLQQRVGYGSPASAHNANAATSHRGGTTGPLETEAAAAGGASPDKNHFQHIQELRREIDQLRLRVQRLEDELGLTTNDTEQN